MVGRKTADDQGVPWTKTTVFMGCWFEVGGLSGPVRLYRMFQPS